MKTRLYRAAGTLCLVWLITVGNPVFGQLPLAEPQDSGVPSHTVCVRASDGHLQSVPSPAPFPRLLQCGRFSAEGRVPCATSADAPVMTPVRPRSDHTGYRTWWRDARDTAAQVRGDFTQAMRNLGDSLTGLSHGLSAAGERCRQAARQCQDTAERVSRFTDAVGQFFGQFSAATASFSAIETAPTQPRPVSRIDPKILDSGFRYIWVREGGRIYGTNNPQDSPVRPGETGWQRIDTQQAREVR